VGECLGVVAEVPVGDRVHFFPVEPEWAGECTELVEGSWACAMPPVTARACTIQNEHGRRSSDNSSRGEFVSNHRAGHRCVVAQLRLGHDRCRPAKVGHRVSLQHGIIWSILRRSSKCVCRCCH
jgi:hypothetical protein